ncbi:uncharacterized protein LOC131955464 [Physella acuta]|uniref:uncharacterized protein LOC131955464 n=1 Tax=Physella acuta TaxID=109671 RepID=UPI0027DCC96F|nr:uncharacterized protein LOC131955464 [Physella acuta]
MQQRNYHPNFTAHSNVSIPVNISISALFHEFLHYQPYHGVDFFFFKRALLPAVTYLAVCLITGCIGNIVALVTHAQHVRVSVTRMCVFVLACQDFLTCVLVIPLEIVMLVKFLNFPSSYLCQASKYTQTVLNTYQTLVFVGIAVERYNKICRSTEQGISVEQATKVCVQSLVVSCVVNIPVLFLYGEQSLSVHATKTSGENQYLLEISPAGSLNRTLNRTHEYHFYAKLCAIKTEHFFDTVFVNAFFIATFSCNALAFFMVTFLYARVIKTLHAMKNNVFLCSRMDGLQTPIFAVSSNIVSARSSNLTSLSGVFAKRVLMTESVSIELSDESGSILRETDVDRGLTEYCKKNASSEVDADTNNELEQTGSVVKFHKAQHTSANLTDISEDYSKEKRVNISQGIDTEPDENNTSLPTSFSKYVSRTKFCIIAILISYFVSYVPLIGYRVYLVVRGCHFYKTVSTLELGPGEIMLRSTFFFNVASPFWFTLLSKAFSADIQGKSASFLTAINIRLQELPH